MGTEPRTATQPSRALRPGVRHLLSAAVDASPLAITCAEVCDAGEVVATLHRAGTATTRVDHRLDDSGLGLVLEGEATTDDLERFAATLAGPVRALLSGLEGRHASRAGTASAPGSLTIDLTELEELEHRVRTRLTVARGWVELLRTRGVEPTSDLDPLAIASRQLGDIEDVLRAGLGRTRTRPSSGTRNQMVDLAGAVERTLAESAWSLDPRVTGPLVSGDPRPVLLDGGDLRDAVLHLVDNATHHTPPDTAVEVWLSYRAGWVELAVEDAGPGLPDHGERTRGVGMQVVQRLATTMEAHLELDRSVRLGGAAIRLLWRR
jgi:signal transduction histidine kinase